MLSQARYLVNRALGRDRAGRGLEVYPDDVFLVSYPRSGNTWTRFLVANLLHPGAEVTFENVERLAPDIHAHSKRYLSRVPRPRVLKSHEYFDRRYKKVIYIVRDPRDVVVSSYHFHRKQRQIPDDYPIALYVRDFIDGAVFNTYASWGANVGSWLGAHDGNPGTSAGGRGLFGSWMDNVEGWMTARRGSRDFLVLRYEDMTRQPEIEVSKVAEFLSLGADPGRIAQAVERSSTRRMRELEKAQSSAWVTTRDTRQDIPFVRGAGPGGWRASLPRSSAEELEAAWGNLMTSLGYRLECVQPARHQASPEASSAGAEPGPIPANQPAIPSDDPTVGSRPPVP